MRRAQLSSHSVSKRSPPKVYRRSVGCETPDAFAEVVVGANGVKHSVCRFGGIGGVSLIEVSSALGELNCRCRCSPMGVEVSS
eukprot:g48078.t1